MELQILAPQIERSCDFKESSFSIGDEVVIMNILRHKIYSNPIRSMIQEVLSNAKDANVEAGNPDKPIFIKFPDLADDSFYIKDNGIGITPDRMENVFLKYGCSSKRKDNTQIGGFGIGAKTPFAYSDCFNIETITSDGYKRVYAAYIDETQRGKMALLSEEITDEPTGTKIVVPVKKGDEHKFVKAVEEVCFAWKIKPETNASIYFKDIDSSEHIIWQDANTKVMNYRVFDNHCLILLLNEIPYRIMSDSRYDESGFISQFTVIHNANVGDVTISANRENVEYDDKTNNYIKAVLGEIQKKIVVEVVEQINKLPNYRAAHNRYVNFYDYYRRQLLKECYYNGVPLHRDPFEKINGNWVRAYLTDINKIRVVNGGSYREAKNDKHIFYVLGSEKEVNYKSKIKKYLIDNNISSAYIFIAQRSFKQETTIVGEVQLPDGSKSNKIQADFVFDADKQNEINEAVKKTASILEMVDLEPMGGFVAERKKYVRRLPSEREYRSYNERVQEFYKEKVYPENKNFWFKTSGIKVIFGQKTHGKHCIKFVWNLFNSYYNFANKPANVKIFLVGPSEKIPENSEDGFLFMTKILRRIWENGDFQKAYFLNSFYMRYEISSLWYEISRFMECERIKESHEIFRLMSLREDEKFKKIVSAYNNCMVLMDKDYDNSDFENPYENELNDLIKKYHRILFPMKYGNIEEYFNKMIGENSNV